MEQIRDVIFTACMCAILGSAVKLISPARMKKEMRLICTLMLVICVAARFSGGFVIDTRGILSGAEERRAEFGDAVLDETAKSLKARLDSRLEELGIFPAETGIVCTYDEYNYVRAERVSIRLFAEDSSSAEAAREAAKELFPDCETEVTADVIGGENKKSAER